jgi:predicted deacylase
MVCLATLSDAAEPSADKQCGGLGDASLAEIPCPAEVAGDPKTPSAGGPSKPAESALATREFKIFGDVVLPGSRKQLSWSAGQSFAGAPVDTPVHVLHGNAPGPTVCLFAAIHGDELNGIEIVRQILKELDPKDLHGTIIGIPIVNLLGFTRGSRYLPDHRDLNRYFPGNRTGSAASRIAYLFFEQVVKQCHYVVDFHTGSSMRSNLPQLRADLNDPAVLEFTRHFGATSVLQSPGARGMLRREASVKGIPAVTFELGEPTTVQPEHVTYGVRAIETLLEKLAMVKRFKLWAEPQPVYYASRWVRADRGGILMTATKLGARVAAGDVLGTVTNPITNDTVEIRAPSRGRVLGMALNQFVLPGFAAFHIGVEAEPSEAVPANGAADGDIEGDTEQEPRGIEEVDGEGDE